MGWHISTSPPTPTQYIMHLHKGWICLWVYSSSLALTKGSSNFIIKSFFFSIWKANILTHAITTIMALNPPRCNVLPILRNIALQAPNEYKLGQKSQPCQPKPQEWLNEHHHHQYRIFEHFCNHALALC